MFLHIVKQNLAPVGRRAILIGARLCFGGYGIKRCQSVVKVDIGTFEQLYFSLSCLNRAVQAFLAGGEDSQGGKQGGETANGKQPAEEEVPAPTRPSPPPRTRASRQVIFIALIYSNF